MSLRNIVKEGDPCLTRKCRPVTEFNKHLFELLDDMHETLQKANGAGLAAPQVGVIRCAALVMLEEGKYLEIINPKITELDGEQTGTEGCLSVPDRFGIVKRPMRVTVEAQDRNGKAFTYKAEGFTARAFCHEIDHLNGHMFTELVIRYLKPDEDE